MLTVTPAGFRNAGGELLRYIELQGISPNPEWIAAQEASIGEYLDHNAMVPSEVETLYQLFDGFIASELVGMNGLNIIDVGCGIRRDLPHYARSIIRGQSKTENAYVGLDPLILDIDSRAYPFIAGRLEDLPGTLSSRFDVFLFATSLDHFESLSEVARSVSSMANAGAKCIFWVGMHDPATVAEQVGAHIFRKLFTSLHPAIFFPRYFEAAAKIAVDYARLLKRRANLLAGRPLDNLHFHYFTERNLQPALELFGRVERYLHVPGTNSIFATVQSK